MSGTARFTCLLAALALGGCATYDAGFFPYGEVHPPRDPGAPVELYRGEPGRPHRELGELIVTGGTYADFEGLRAALLDKARAVGADAVKLVRITPLPPDYDVYWHGDAFYYPGCWGWGWGWGLGWGYPSVYARRLTQVRGVAIVWTGPPPEADRAGEP